MSRMIMSVVSVAMGGEQQEGGGAGGASLVSNTFYAGKAGFTLSLSICVVVIYSHLVTDLDQFTTFRSCALTIFAAARRRMAFEYPINFEVIKSNLGVFSYIVSGNPLL